MGSCTEVWIDRRVLPLRIPMFSRLQENLPLHLNWVETNTCPIRNLLLAKEMHSFIQYKNYELVNEDVSGRGLNKSATSSLYNLFYITLGVLMAAFAPVTSQLAWLPSV